MSDLTIEKNMIKLIYSFLIIIVLILPARAISQEATIALQMPFSETGKWQNFEVKNGDFVAQKGNTWFIYGLFGNINTPTKYPSWNDQHNGIDFEAKAGLSVQAVASGKVVYVDWLMGNTVIIKHENGFYTSYGHLDKIITQKGRVVTTGQKIGTVGKTGTDHYHLHFELDRKVGNSWIAKNPLPYINSQFSIPNFRVNTYKSGSQTPSSQHDFEWSHPLDI